jgi:hypothetical protein
MVNILRLFIFSFLLAACSSPPSSYKCEECKLFPGDEVQRLLEKLNSGEIDPRITPVVRQKFEVFRKSYNTGCKIWGCGCKEIRGRVFVFLLWFGNDTTAELEIKMAGDSYLVTDLSEKDFSHP